MRVIFDKIMQCLRESDATDPAALEAIAEQASAEWEDINYDEK